MPKTTTQPRQSKPWYTIRAAADGNTAEVLIYGDIGDSWFGDSVTAQQFVEDLQGLADRDITVRINSYGGSVSDGVAIYNAISRHPKAKTVAIDGVALSIASLIAMSGDTVQMAENALFMIHAPWGGASGNAKVMREYADLLDKFALSMTSSYARKSGQTTDAVLGLLTDGTDHWYSAEEALAAGYVDEVTTATAEAANYRQAAFARFKIPAAVAAAYRPQEVIMPDVKPNPAATPNTPAVVQSTEEQVQAALNTRNTQIRTLFARFAGREGMAEMETSCLSDTMLTIEQVQAKILAKLGEGSEPLAHVASGRIEAGQDAGEKRVVAMSQSILVRMGQGKPDGTNPYRGARLLDLARVSLKAAGINPDGMSVLELAQASLTYRAPRGAQTTSDFPVILENTLHKLVLSGFMAQPATWQRFCKIGSVSDFRSWNRLVPGLLGNLDDVNEHGEYKNKNIPDAQKNAIAATRKGNIINITPEVLVNDDIGYIQDLASGLGATGQRAIERAAYTLLNSNPTMSDGIALYHASHGNLAGSGAVPSVVALDAARQAMGSQKAPGDDQEYLDIAPAVAVVPLSQGGNTRVIVNAVYDPDTANKLQRPNMVNGIVKDVVDSPRVTGTVWHLFADPNVAPVYEVVFLDGQQTPTVTEDVNFRTSGVAWKVELPFGAGAIDWRGGYRNPGA